MLLQFYIPAVRFNDPFPLFSCLLSNFHGLLYAKFRWKIRFAA